MVRRRELRGRKLADVWELLGLRADLALEKWKMSLWAQRSGWNVIEADFRKGVRISEKVRLIDWIKGRYPSLDG
jgi:hypothetical protein